MLPSCYCARRGDKLAGAGAGVFMSAMTENRFSICRRFLPRAWAGLLALQVGAADAGYFDCNVVYDEFEQLMTKNFLVEPDRYVSVVAGRLTRKDFIDLQKGRFTLRAEREGFGIGIVQTNRNTRGKFLFSWNQSPREDLIPLVIEETVLYGRVSDGYAPRRLAPIYVKPSFAVDLDSGQVLDAGHETTDVVYNIQDGVFYIEAVNGASLQFPLESMCHAPAS